MIYDKSGKRTWEQSEHLFAGHCDLYRNVTVCSQTAAATPIQ